MNFTFKPALCIYHLKGCTSDLTLMFKVKLTFKQNICFKLLNGAIWNFAFTIKLFIDQMILKTGNLDHDLQAQIGI